MPEVIHRHNCMIFYFEFRLRNSSRLAVLHVEVVVELLNPYLLTIDLLKSYAGSVCTTNQIDHYFIALALIGDKHNGLLEPAFPFWRE